MEVSGNPKGKLEEMIDWRDPADMKGITTHRRRPTVKEQWARRMLGWERSDIVLVSRRMLSRSDFDWSRSMDLIATTDEGVGIVMQWAL